MQIATSNPNTGTNRWIALMVLCVGVLMIILDATIVNVALPSIQSDLGFSQSSLAWVVNAYLIAFGGLLLLAGRLGDLLGRRRIFLIGLTVFTTASLLCGLADSQGLLVGARFVQGIGGAMTAAVILGMIVTMFPEPGEQARAIGVYSFVAAAGGSIGLLAGGGLTQAINWHWIFFVNVPIGIATAVLALRLIGRDEGIGLKEGADVAGAVLIAVMSLGASARLNMRFGAQATLLPGLAMIVGGLLLFARAPVDANYVTEILPVMVLLGIGAGVSFPSLMTLAMTGATRSDSGLASGLVNTSQQVGGALGLAVLATLASSHSKGLVAAGQSQGHALTGGYHLAFLIGAGLLTAAIAVAVTVLTGENLAEVEELEPQPDVSAEPAYSKAA